MILRQVKINDSWSNWPLCNCAQSPRWTKKKAYTKSSNGLIELIPPDYLKGSNGSLSNGSTNVKSEHTSNTIDTAPSNNKESITNTSNKEDPVSTAEGDPEEPTKKINRNVGFNQLSVKK